MQFRGGKKALSVESSATKAIKTAQLFLHSVWDTPWGNNEDPRHLFVFERPLFLNKSLSWGEINVGERVSASTSAHSRHIGFQASDFSMCSNAACCMCVIEWGFLFVCVSEISSKQRASQPQWWHRTLLFLRHRFILFTIVSQLLRRKILGEESRACGASGEFAKVAFIPPLENSASDEKFCMSTLSAIRNQKHRY
jgi:hypothetical protein